ncbi:fibronectin type III domain-containing protein [Streptomyces yunnanensis]|uniref:Fibronectin type III domain-containing protein n=1 Tax=Streptomyces yunnanensis TaxID=156453 RepID=A0ABY8A563_9ACTN|nr:fibronectin type III domain-containing protein [Streptomyces yunnanensis]WEB38837.1 fibronectin type III domain-containing protein [Streptomyces yunnanensis]
MSIARRSLLTGSTAAVAAGALGTAGSAEAAGPARPGPDPLLARTPGRLGVPGVTGLHLQFGADPATEMTVSWISPCSVRRPQVRLGTHDGGTGNVVDAETRTYRDGLSHEEVYVHHARLTGLRPDTTYLYSAGHDGTAPETGAFTTAPRGRTAFTFTSFGDQGAPNLRRVVTWPAGGAPSPSGRFPLYTSSQAGSPAAADIVAAVERVGPLFNLVNGDLCYASAAGLFGQNRVATWADWFIGNSRSTRLRPWMPCVGNGENEKGNGPLGLTGYQTYFTLPGPTGTDPETRGLWYAFTVGAVRFISLANDDVAIQDTGDTYVRGYSGGAQRQWLERELKAARGNAGIDWIVVFMHHPMISSSRSGSGSDVGIRAAWGPLFDAYGVDLVLCGHEHYYERSLPVRGAMPNEARTPVPVSTRTDVADTAKGTVHMIIGGGGNFATTQDDLFQEPKGRVVVDLAKETEGRHRKAIFVTEDAPWRAVQDRVHTHGFAAFDVDPGDQRTGRTRIHVTYYTFDGPYGDLTPVDTFTLERPRRDARP